MGLFLTRKVNAKAYGGGVAAWAAWPSVDIDGNITGRNLRCERCGWQTTYITGRRKAAMKKHMCKSA